MSAGVKRREVIAVQPEESSSPAMPPHGDDSLPQIIRDVNRGFARAVQGRIASFGISMGHWFFLRALWIEDGLTQRELSQRAGMMEPTTVTAINAMERQDLVRRVRNHHDRRKVNVFLTDRGRALQHEVLPSVAGVATGAVQGLPADEVTRAVELLRKVGLNLNAMTIPRSGERNEGGGELIPDIDL